MELRRATETGARKHLQLAYNALCIAITDLERHGKDANAEHVEEVSILRARLEQVRAELGKVAWPIPS